MYVLQTILPYKFRKTSSIYESNFAVDAIFFLIAGQ